VAQPEPPTGAHDTAGAAVASTRVWLAIPRFVGEDSVRTVGIQTVDKDFAYVAGRLPNMLFFAGVKSRGQDPATAPDNHSDLVYFDETALEVGLRSILRVAVDYLELPRPELPSK
jgi:metal-dependent amidase/aminoacylase/carboxypeptidase family protein